MSMVFYLALCITHILCLNDLPIMVIETFKIDGYPQLTILRQVFQALKHRFQLIAR